ncbi:MAG: hypothetical protein ED559_10875 [Phycisphaera sp.]|nr:MAG: hypothetical protein ED559_10875 [Phycisphaera sp.]
MAHQQLQDEFRQPKKSNAGKIILVGCLSVVIAIMLLVGVGGIYVWQNWRDWTADITTQAVNESFKEIHLPDEERIALMERVNFLADEFRDKNISLDEFKNLGEAMTESDFLPMLISKAMYGGYIAPSTLSDEEKARGELAFGRLARGFTEDKLKDSDFEAVFAPISNNKNLSVTVGSEGFSTNDDLDIKAPNQVTAAELLEMIENAEKLADEKELSPEPLEVDLVEELDKLISETIGKEFTPAGGE